MPPIAPKMCTPHRRSLHYLPGRPLIRRMGINHHALHVMFSRCDKFNIGRKNWYKCIHPEYVRFRMNAFIQVPVVQLISKTEL